MSKVQQVPQGYQVPLSPTNLHDAILREMGIGPRRPKKIIQPIREPKVVKQDIQKYEPTEVTPFMPADMKRYLKDNLLSFNKSYEVEGSLGTYNISNNFQPGLSSSISFAQLRDILSQSKTLEAHDISRDVVYIARNLQYDGRKLNMVRKIVSKDNIIYETKNQIRDKVIDNVMWGYRIKVAKEEILDDSLFSDDIITNFDNIATLVRYRTRYTFVETAKKSPFYGLRIDMTYVEEKNFFQKGRKVENPKTYTKYEVELERIKKTTADNFAQSLEILLAYSQGVLDPSLDTLSSLPERRYAISLHNSIFIKDIKNPKIVSSLKNNPYRLYKDYWNKPVPLKTYELLEPSFQPAITVKYDGSRRFVLLDTVSTYMFAPPNDFYKIGKGVSDNDAGTFIDCELVDDTLYAFDLLFYKGKDYRNENFFERFEKLKDVIKNSIKPRSLFNLKIKLKEFYMSKIMSKDDQKLMIFANKETLKTLQNEYDNLLKKKNKAKKKKEKAKILKQLNTVEKRIETLKNKITETLGNKKPDKEDFYKHTRIALKAMEKLDRKIPGSTDGLIFQYLGPYINDNTFKWKPIDLITIDFRLVPTEKTDVYNALASVFINNKVEERVFTGTPRHPFDGKITIKGGLVDGYPVSNSIVESRWDFKKNVLVPYRIRFDRDKPNREFVAKSNWNDMHNPITKGTLKGETLQVARVFFNKYKGILLNKYAKNKVLLDIGSGRGGDIRKWDKVKAKKVYSLEPDKETRKEFRRRKESMKDITTEIKLLGYGAEKTEKIVRKMKNEKVDVAISFFSLTFFAKNEKMMKGLVMTLDSVVKKGGYFIGAVLDGKLTREFLEYNREKENIPDEEAVAYENSAFSIEQTSLFSDPKKEPYGDEIEINVVDETSMVKKQTEWLVYFNNLKKLLGVVGFSLERTDTLDTTTVYDQLPSDSKEFVKLQRMFVFKKDE